MFEPGGTLTIVLIKRPGEKDVVVPIEVLRPEPGSPPCVGLVCSFPPLSLRLEELFVLRWCAGSAGFTSTHSCCFRG